MLDAYRRWRCRHNHHRCITSLPKGMRPWVLGINEGTGETKLFPSAICYGQMTCPDCGLGLYTYRGRRTGRQFEAC